MWGMAAQTEFRALEDKLHLQFDFGYASGQVATASLLARQPTAIFAANDQMAQYLKK